MKIKINEATELQLDWLVAKCEGYTLVFFDDFLRRNGVASGISEARVESILHFQPFKGKWERLNAVGGVTAIEKYSTDWSQGGPIIEREGIDIQQVFCYMEGSFAEPCGWAAFRHTRGGPINPERFVAPTPLIAAMRCYVASKLGDTVEVPEELI